VDAGLNVLIVDLNAIACALSVLLQVIKQRAIATTQIQNAGAFGYKARDGLQIHVFAHG
jgi:hypothetical protein